MTTSPSPLLYCLRRLRAPQPTGHVALLERFVSTRDHSAFADLVDLHGPAVWGLCRRVLSDLHAAEDALQARFLVRARRAGQLRRPEALAGWLYGVASIRPRTCRTKRTFPWETNMSNAALARPAKSVVLMVLGLITLLLGGAHVALGVCLILVGEALARPLREGDPEGGLAVVVWLAGALMTALGVAFVPQGILEMLAGLGVLLRKQWGRILTFIVAVLAILWGLACLGAYKQDTAANTVFLASGAAQILYGILVFVVLIQKRTEFSQLRT
jgi:hypothetical protein